MLNRILKFLNSIVANIFRDDPIYNCEVYKTQTCVHIDSLLCNMETCEILKEYKENKKTSSTTNTTENE